MADDVLVHILRAGHPLCSRPDTPNHWPANHRWVAWNNVPKHILRHGGARYCETCRARYAVDDEQRRLRVAKSMKSYRERE